MFEGRAEVTGAPGASGRVAPQLSPPGSVDAAGVLRAARDLYPADEGAEDASVSQNLQREKREFLVEKYALAIAPALLGLAWIFWDRRRQGWHDKLGDCVVIRDDDALRSLTDLARHVS